MYGHWGVVFFVLRGQGAKGEGELSHRFFQPGPCSGATHSAPRAQLYGPNHESPRLHHGSLCFNLTRPRSFPQPLSALALRFNPPWRLRSS